MSVFDSLFAAGGTGGWTLGCGPLQIVADTTGVVAQLRSNLPGPQTFSRISGTSITVSAAGAVTFSTGLPAGQTRQLVARVQNPGGLAVERAFTFEGFLPEGYIPPPPDALTHSDGVVTWTLAAARPIGVYEDGYSGWVLAPSGATLASETPASAEYDDPGLGVGSVPIAPAVTGGMEWKPGNAARAAALGDNSGIAGNFGFGSAAGGSNRVGLDFRVNGTSATPARNAAHNVSPTRPGGTAFEVPGAETGTLVKAVSRQPLTEAAGQAGWLVHLATLSFVSEVPAADAFRPASCADTAASPLRVSDITLAGLPSVSGLGPTARDVIVRSLRPIGIYESVTSVTGNQAFRSQVPDAQGGQETNEMIYGGTIARMASHAAVYLSSDASSADKMIVARAVCRAAIGIAGRAYQGGIFGCNATGGPYSAPNGHCNYALPLLLLAAVLTRDSARGAYFRDLLGPTYYLNINAIPGPRRIVANDWISPTSIRDSSSTEAGMNENLGYNSMRLRPHHEGNIGAAFAAPAGASRIASRLSTRSYLGIYWGACLGVMTLVTRMGLRSLIDRADYWEWWDMAAEAQIKQPAAGKHSDRWELTYMPANQLALAQHPTAGWIFPARPAPVRTRASVATQLVQRERWNSTAGAMEYDFVEETMVEFQFSEYLTRDNGRLPPNTAWTITKNGSPATIIAATATGSDAGAQQVRGRSVACAVAEAAAAGDSWVASCTMMGPGGQLLTLDGQAVPAQVSVPLTVRTVPLAAPTAELVSFGGLNANDSSKAMLIKNNMSYMATRGYNSSSSSPTTFRKVLVGFPLKLQGASTVAELAGRVIFCGSDATGNFRLRIFNTAGDLRLDGGSPSSMNFTLPGFITAGDLGQERMIWMLVDQPAGIVRGRKDGAAPVTGTSSGTAWADNTQGWDWRRLLGAADRGNFAFGGGNEASGDPPTIGNAGRFATRYLWLATDVGHSVAGRSWATPDLATLPSDPAASLGDRGEAVLGGGYIPEIYMPLTFDAASANSAQNVGWLNGMSGYWPDDEGSQQWFRG